VDNDKMGNRDDGYKDRVRIQFGETYMKLHTGLIIGFLAMSWSNSLALAVEPDYSKASIPELIDALVKIDSKAPGLDGTAVYDGFIGDDSPGHFQMGLLGVTTPTVPLQMRELERRGAAALPELLAHLDDKRPTALQVGNVSGQTFYMFTYFSDEYAARDLRQKNQFPKEKPFEGAYRVKVGDVCFVIIGQIVNRTAIAVRYQPSGGLVVNSPIEMPDLADKVRRDWSGVDKETLKSVFLMDIHSKLKGSYKELAFSALKRLRFYYPEIYGALKGDDLKKKEKFEADERKGL
jgi:hypothetical protein